MADGLWFLLLLLPLVYGDAAGLNNCVDLTCQGGNCYSVRCDHGRCGFHGDCVCDNCWSGQSCDVPVQNAVPYFRQSAYEFDLEQVDLPSGSYVGAVSAIDPDLGVCRSDQPECPCALVQYSLVHYDDDAGLIVIDPDTGLLTTAVSLDAFQGQRLQFTVRASNPGQSSHNEAKVTVTVASQDTWSDVKVVANKEVIREGHRSKRAFPGVSNVTMTMTKNTNSTSLYVGSTVQFTLDIQFPHGTTDMLVELLTPENDTTIMMLCGVTIDTVGSALNQPSAVIVLEKSPLDAPYTYHYNHAILDFGNVTNYGNASLYQDEIIRIKWETVLLRDSSLQNNTVYYVSAGTAYYNQMEIWIGQAAFTAYSDYYVPSVIPTFNLSGPSTVRVGASATFILDMYLTNDSSDLTVSVFAPFNSSGLMSVCSLLVKSVGTHYECLPIELLQSTPYDQDGLPGNEYAVLQLGNVVNAGVRDAHPLDYDRITVAFALYVNNAVTLIGGDFWVGAAVEVGSSQIWAGQIKVTATSFTGPEGSTGPTVSLMSNSTQTAVPGQTIQFLIQVTLAPSSEIVISMSGSIPNSALSFCDIKRKHSGLNIPCFTDSLPVLTGPSPGVYSSFTWALGPVRNTGVRTNASDNSLTIEIFVNALSTATAGTYPFTVSVVSNPALISPTQPLTLTVNLVSSSSSSLSGASVDMFDMNLAFGSPTLSIGSATDAIFTIATNPGEMYGDMLIRFLTDIQNQQATMNLCRVEITDVGTNLPCFNKDYRNQSITYASSLPYNWTSDVASVTTGPLCNIGDVNGTSNITFSIVAEVMDTLWTKAGNLTYINVGISYNDSYTLVVGQLAITPTQITTTQGLVNTSFYRWENSTNSTGSLLYNKMTGFFRVNVTLPPQSRADVTVIATGSTQLSVCAVRVASKGHGYPCVNTSKVPTMTPYNNGYNQKGQLGYQPITNVDVVGDANSTITFEVMAYMIASAGSQTLNIQVTSGSSTSQQTFSVTSGPTPVVPANVSTQPSFNLSLVQLQQGLPPSLNIAKGETKLVELDIWFKPDTLNSLLVEFHTDITTINEMDIRHLTITHVGRNLPCVVARQLQANYTNRGGTTLPAVRDIAGIDLGPVQHVSIYTDEDVMDDVISLQAAVRVRNDSTVVIGQTLVLSATVSRGSDEIYVTSSDFTVITNDAFDLLYETLKPAEISEYIMNYTSVTINSSEAFWRPGSTYDLYLGITIAPNTTSRVIVDVLCQTNASATATVNNIQVVAAGGNLEGVMTAPDTEFFVQSNSTLGSTQHNTGYLDLGVVTNTGYVWPANSSDNELVLLLTVLMADAAVSTDNAMISVGVGVTQGDTRVSNTTSVTVKRLGDEEPLLQVTGNNTDGATYDSSVVIPLSLLVQHSNLSSSEAYNVSLKIYIPGYLNYRNLTSHNYSSGQLVVQVDLESVIKVTLPAVYFTDVILIDLGLEVNTSASIPFTDAAVNATIVVQTFYQAIHRGSSPWAASNWFCSDLYQVNYYILLATPSCNAGVLGLQSCQLSGSYTDDPVRLPVKARLGQGSVGWLPAWRSNWLPYLQVSFGNQTLVTDVMFLKVSGATVNRYQILYSNDALTWTTGPQLVWSGIKQSVTSVSTSRFIRIQIIDLSDEISAIELQVELYGCTVSADVTLQQVCSAPVVVEQSPPRSFLSTPGGDLYVCDLGECYTGNTNVWQPLDPRLTRVLGYDNNGRVYGLSDQGYMMTTDGLKWDIVTEGYYQQWVTNMAAVVPWTRSSSFNPSNVNNLIQNNGVCANYDGLKFCSSSSNIYDWSTCCP